MLRVVICREAGGLGDVLMTLPIARYYHDRGVVVDYLTLTGYAELVEACPYVGRIYTIPKSARRWRDGAITREYLERCGVPVDDNTRAIDAYCPAWRHEAATAGLPWLNRVEAFWRAACIPAAALPPEPLKYIIECRDVRPDWLPNDWRYALIQKDTNDPMRNVPLELYAPEIERLKKGGVKCITVGARKGEEWPVDMERGRVSTGEMIYLHKHAEYILCGDSGPLHLGAVWNIPTTAWFGPTNGRLICHRYPAAAAVQGKGCGPCYYHRDAGWRDCRNRLKVCRAWDRDK